MTAPNDGDPTGMPMLGGVPAAAAAPADGAKPGRSAARWAVEVVETVVLTLLIFLAVQHFLAQPFQVQGASMETTFENGQYVLVDRLSHAWSPYARGQVVVFQPPAGAEDGGYPFIKRVVGVAGDTVEVRDGRVFVNGTALDEPYLYRDASGAIEPTEPLSGQTTWTVPAGDVFVMGDHREASEDSRAFGPVPVSSIIGRAMLRYWPPSAFGPIQTPAYAP
jgi:signal peptidase I